MVMKKVMVIVVDGDVEGSDSNGDGGNNIMKKRWCDESKKRW